MSAEELAKLAQNPVGNLISLPFQNNTNLNFGPEKGTQNILNIQPVIPISVNEEWNIITRTIVPVISMPSLGPGIDSTQRHRRHRVHRVPVAGQARASGSGAPARSCSCRPTATRELGNKNWGLGPSFVVLHLDHGSPWVYGVLVNNIWSLTSNKQGGSYNNGLIQPFVNYNFKDGVYLTTAPILTVDWKADSGQQMDGADRRRRRQDLSPRQAAGEYAAFRLLQRRAARLRANWQIRAQVQLMFPK